MKICKGISKNNKKYILIVTLLVLSIIYSGCSNDNEISGKITANHFNSEDEIRIGFIGPLSGDYASLGIVEKNVIEIALDEINYTIAGKKVKMIYEDGKCSAKDAVISANKLINSDKVSILFTDCSSETLAVAPIAESNEILLISAYANNQDITNAGDYIFRTSHSDKDLTIKAAKYIKNNFSKTILVYESTAYATGWKDGFIQAYEELGGKTISINFDRGEKDFSTIAKKIGKYDDDYALILLPDSISSGENLLKALNIYKNQKKLFGNYFGGNENIYKMIEAQNMTFFAEPDIKDNDIKKTLFEKYYKNHGKYPEFTYPALSRYDNVFLIKEAIEKVGTNTNDIKNYLYNMEVFTGALGNFSFDENGDIIGIEPSIKRIVNYTPITIG